MILLELFNIIYSHFFLFVLLFVVLIFVSLVWSAMQVRLIFAKYFLWILIISLLFNPPCHFDAILLLKGPQYIINFHTFSRSLPLHKTSFLLSEIYHQSHNESLFLFIFLSTLISQDHIIDNSVICLPFFLFCYFLYIFRKRDLDVILVEL